MGWEPILEGELAERAWVAVRALADDLARLTAPAPDLALFWSYLAAALPDDAVVGARTDAALETFATHIESETGPVHLFGGLTGRAWVAAHVGGGVDDYLELVDQQILGMLASAPAWPRGHDLITGLVGLGVYFLDRGDTPAGRAGRAHVVRHLAASAEHTADGARWHTRVEILPPHQQAEFPRGYHNLGVAHGAGGIVALLARIAERSDAPPETAALRDAAGRWMLAQRLPHAQFPPMIELVETSRTAWCYGTPGIATALWQADLRGAPALPRAELEALTAGWMAVPPAETSVHDAGLCHGASGLAHLANRLYQATGQAAYRDYAIGWFTRTLADRRPTGGLGGFYSYNAASTTGEPWEIEPDLLSGAIGVGLALLAALVPIEPGWDRMLLVDLPLPPER